MTDINISLLFPGYLSPNRGDGYQSSQEGSLCPPAMKWASDYDQLPWQAALCHSLGESGATGLQLPAAALLLGAMDNNTAAVRADPVHLQADRDTAKLLPLDMLDLDPTDADSLIQTINEFLSGDDLHLCLGADRGWYMSGWDGSSLESFPPSFLANRNASAFLPTGNNSEQWRRLMTEIQMLLHTHPVNEKRASQGQLPINSLWFWGGGVPCKAPSASGVNDIGELCVYADDEFSKALCEHLGVPCKGLTDFNPDSTGKAVLVDNRIAAAHFVRDEAALKQATDRINNEWLAPLSARVRAGQITQLQLFNEDGESGLLTPELCRRHARSENVWLKNVVAGVAHVRASVRRWLPGKS